MKSFLSLVFAIPISFSVSFFLTLQMPGRFQDEESQITLAASNYYNQSYFPTLFNYFKGQWGSSWVYPDRSVLSFIQEAFTFSLGFQMVSVVLMILLSISISFFMISSTRFKFFAEKVLFLGTTSPLLFLLPVFIYLFSFYYPLLPLRYDGSFKSYLLPILGLTIRPICFSTLILFDKWTETVRQDYFRTGLAKGLSFSKVLWGHGFKNSALSYVTQVIQFLGQILTGSVLIETLFSLPGLGFLFVESLRNRDLPILMGLVFVFCCLYLVTQILLEWAYRYYEPRSQS